MEGIARLPDRRSRLTVACGENVPFRLFRDCGKAKHLPIPKSLDMSNKVIFVQSLHDEDDATCPFVIEPTEQSVIEPIIGRFSLGVGKSFLRLPADRR
jgi:hypothetical protein